MELVTGEDLSHLLARGGMSVLQSVRIAEEVAEALSEAHRSGIVHRDIKPPNIVINELGQVKVLDFGLAKLYREPAPLTGDSPTILTSATAEGTVLGTPAYMSPEQAREAPLAPRSDLFALGAVLYECLTARRAFGGANSVEILASVLHVDPPPPSQVNARVPAALDAVRKLSPRIPTRATSRPPKCWRTCGPRARGWRSRKRKRPKCSPRPPELRRRPRPRCGTRCRP
jgi:serine/threonine protein kinase